MCDIKNCKQPGEIIYAALNGEAELEVCWQHWENHCDETKKFDLRDYYKRQVAKNPS